MIGVQPWGSRNESARLNSVEPRFHLGNSRVPDPNEHVGLYNNLALQILLFDLQRFPRAPLTSIVTVPVSASPVYNNNSVPCSPCSCSTENSNGTTKNIAPASKAPRPESPVHPPLCKSPTATRVPREEINPAAATNSRNIKVTPTAGERRRCIKVLPPPLEDVRITNRQKQHTDVDGFTVVKSSRQQTAHNQQAFSSFNQFFILMTKARKTVQHTKQTPNGRRDIKSDGKYQRHRR